ncbi:metallophosphoesterase [Conexibacter sp. SYSU D00693]|uniref:metallophosphoesterase n=1 Tax=Conexibacter sp. SYSU D00693 TaxID=2812560 RepID=UPI00196A96D9|nr:metallophosphoesterase [Conexibacter sp. SYSU D00693]
MRTLVVSDLHLGGRTGVDVLRHEGVARERLLAALDGVDRLVLLGDLLELRHGPARDALAAAAPALQAMGEALDPATEVVVVPGNHDHALLAPWLDRTDKPLGLETRVKPTTASPIAAKVAGWLGKDRTSMAYPGVWLRDDVFATHGHVQDVHGTIPTFERLAAGAMQRIAGKVPEGPCTIEDYERVLAPIYAWIHSAAQRAQEGKRAAGAGGASRAYELLMGDGHKPIRARAIAAAFPLGIRGLSLLVGPLSSDLSGDALRRNALGALGEAIDRLGVRSSHVVSGHSHRAGPLPADDPHEWRTPHGVHLHNTGCWVYEGALLSGGDPASPYWPGHAVVVEDEGPPRLERLLGDVELEALRPARSAPHPPEPDRG